MISISKRTLLALCAGLIAGSVTAISISVADGMLTRPAPSIAARAPPLLDVPELAGAEEPVFPVSPPTIPNIPRDFVEIGELPGPPPGLEIPPDAPPPELCPLYSTAPWCINPGTPGGGGGPGYLDR